MPLCRSSTQVSLKAREVLIAGQMPSYEERRVQMETVLKASVGGSYYGEQGVPGHRFALHVILLLSSFPDLHDLGLRPLRFSGNSATRDTPSTTSFRTSFPTRILV